MSDGYQVIQCLRHFAAVLRVGERMRPAAARAAEELGIDPTTPMAEHDRRLVIRSREHDDPAALLCLRCRLSHPAKAKLEELYTKHGEQHGLDWIAMASFVLDDDGETQLPGGLPFRWSVLFSLPHKTLQPFSAEVLRSYNPDLCGLPHWTRVNVKGHPELKAYLKQQGLLLISDGALLAKCSSTRVREAWERCGSGSLSTEQVCSLHRAYLQLYPDAKEAYRHIAGKSAGWSFESDGPFIEALTPGGDHFQTCAQLESIAIALRMFLGGTPTADGFAGCDPDQHTDKATFSAGAESYDDVELLAAIVAALERVLNPAVRYALAADQSVWRKSPDRHLAWQLYGEGLSQRQIAERTAHQQAWVSKVLSEKQLATSIATSAAVELSRQPAFSHVARSLEGAERLVEALRNHLTQPEQEGEVSPLRRAVAQLLASFALDS